MKFYSEILNKKFDTQKECEEAEKSYAKQKQSEAIKHTTEYKDRLGKAYDAYKQALKDSETAKETAKKILDESNAQIEKILNEAEKRCSEAYTDLYNVLSDSVQSHPIYKYIMDFFD